MVAPDPELGALADIFLLGSTSCRGIVHPDIQHQHSALIRAVIPPHIGQRSIGLDHNGDPMQLCVARMKHVTRHGGLDRSAEEPVKRGREVGGDGLG
jgi:hypothetical protein